MNAGLKIPNCKTVDCHSTDIVHVITYIRESFAFRYEFTQPINALICHISATVQIDARNVIGVHLKKKFKNDNPRTRSIRRMCNVSSVYLLSMRQLLKTNTNSLKLSYIKLIYNVHITKA